MGDIWHLGYWNSNGLLLFQCLILFLGWKDWYESFRSLLWTWSCGLRLELEHSEIRNRSFKEGRFMTVCACENCVLCLCSLLWDSGCLWYWFGRLHVYLWSGMPEDCKPENFASPFTLKWWCGSFWYWLRGWGQPHMGEEREIGWLWYFHSHFLVPFSLFINKVWIVWIILYVCLFLHSIMHTSLVSSTFRNICVYDTLQSHKFEERDN